MPKKDSEIARVKATDVAPEFTQPGTSYPSPPKTPFDSQKTDAPESTMVSQASQNTQRSMEDRDGPPGDYGNREVVSSQIQQNHSMHNMPHSRESTQPSYSVSNQSNYTQNTQPSYSTQNNIGGAPPSGDRSPNANHVQAPRISVANRDNASYSSVDSRTFENEVIANHRPPDSKREREMNKSTLAPVGPPKHRLSETRAPPSERLSNLLNPNTVTDHFDQYRTHDPLSKRGHSADPTTIRRVTHRDQPPSHMHGTEDATNRPLQRRKTMPSIMKGIPLEPPPPEPPLNYDPDDMPPLPIPKPKQEPIPIARTTDDLKGGMSEPDRYVIENGVRKRVKAEVYRRPSRPADPIVPRTKLPSRYKLETRPLGQSGKRGSMPDVSQCRELRQSVMPREEVSKLSERRRIELRRMEEEAERRKQQEIVLRLADFKDWCQQRQLLMLVIALNVSLATMFFNLLSQ